MEQKKRILIRRGTVVSDQSVSQMDVLIEGEQIRGLGGSSCNHPTYRRDFKGDSIGGGTGCTYH
jgi:hypothetical protein